MWGQKEGPSVSKKRTHHCRIDRTSVMSSGGGEKGTSDFSALKRATGGRWGGGVTVVSRGKGGICYHDTEKPERLHRPLGKKRKSGGQPFREATK